MQAGVNRGLKRSETAPRRESVRGSWSLSKRSLRVQRGVSAVSTNPAPVMVTPVTHIVAGVSVPLGRAIKARIEVSANRVNKDFVESIDGICAFFAYCLEQGYLKPCDVSKMIAIAPAGRHEQVKVCLGLIDHALSQLVDADRVTAMLRRLPTCDDGTNNHDSMLFNGTDTWGFDFSLSVDMLSDSEWGFEEATTGLHIVTTSFGLTVLGIDLLSLNIPKSMLSHLFQLIEILARASGHATAIDLITDETVQEWVSGLTPEESLDSKFMSYPEVEQYKLSMDACTQLRSMSRGRSTPTKQSIESLISSMRKDSTNTPEWMVSTAMTLLEGYVPGNDLYDGAIIDAGFPFAYSRPIGLGIPNENNVFECLHEAIAYGEENRLYIKLGTNTQTILNNVDLAEKLLIYVSDQTILLNTHENDNG